MACFAQLTDFSLMRQAKHKREEKENVRARSGASEKRPGRVIEFCGLSHSGNIGL
jgi:hypothetical protein